jgi:hypothetical protein
MDGVWYSYDEGGNYLSMEKYDNGFLEVERRYEGGIMVMEIDNIHHTVKDFRQKEEKEEERGEE